MRYSDKLTWSWGGKHVQNVYGSGGIRTHASEETGALNQRLRPLGHATYWAHWGTSQSFDGLVSNSGPSLSTCYSPVDTLWFSLLQNTTGKASNCRSLMSAGMSPVLFQVLSSRSFSAWRYLFCFIIWRYLSCFSVYGHITLNTPVLVRSLKLSKVETC